MLSHRPVVELLLRRRESSALYGSRLEERDTLTLAHLSSFCQVSVRLTDCPPVNKKRCACLSRALRERTCFPEAHISSRGRIYQPQRFLWRQASGPWPDFDSCYLSFAVTLHALSYESTFGVPLSAIEETPPHIALGVRPHCELPLLVLSLT